MTQFSTKNGQLLCVLGVKHDSSIFGAHLKMGFKVQDLKNEAIAVFV